MVKLSIMLFFVEKCKDQNLQVHLFVGELLVKDNTTAQFYVLLNDPGLV